MLSLINYLLICVMVNMHGLTNSCNGFLFSRPFKQGMYHLCGTREASKLENINNAVVFFFLQVIPNMSMASLTFISILDIHNVMLPARCFGR